MFTLLLFIVILSILVVAHEFGHFITARLSGMRVHEFGIGFPPRMVGFYRDPKTKRIVWVFGRGSSDGDTVLESEFPATVYSLNWLPLGGFCNIKGESGEEASESDSFGAHKAWKRLVVLVAGVAMNFLLAAILLGIGFSIGLPFDFSGGVDPRAIVVQEPSVVAGEVEKNSPAEDAGMRFGDKILSLNGSPMNSSRDVIVFVRQNGAKEMTVAIERNGGQREFSVTPRVLTPGDAPRIGVLLADAGMIRYPWHAAIPKGFVAAWWGLVNTFIGLYILVRELLTGHGLAFNVSGPVGIAVVVGQSARMGFNYLLNVTAMISLSLAAINILPIPALDGGRALFVVLEKIFRRSIPMRYEQLAHTAGFVLLLILIVLVTGRDVWNLF